MIFQGHSRELPLGPGRVGMYFSPMLTQGLDTLKRLGKEDILSFVGLTYLYAAPYPGVSADSPR